MTKLSENVRKMDYSITFTSTATTSFIMAITIYCYGVKKNKTTRITCFVMVGNGDRPMITCTCKGVGNTYYTPDGTFYPHRTSSNIKY